jgi:serine/threonine protein kinase
MDSLSPELSHQLQSLGLCTPRDLKRCRARVRRMSRDLPAFDSVWIDALVQRRRLSPYQAKLCMAAGPEELAVGPLVLVERIGSDGRLEAFTARQPGSDTLVEVTRLHAPDGAHAAVQERLQTLLASLRAARSPQVLTATAVQIDRERVVAIAPLAGGKSLAELLVRRGRFPTAAVVEIARQLAAGLEQLERSGALHGDLRLRTVRLDLQGRLFLTQPGLLAALEPTVTIHTEIPADAYDGIAPELIDSRAPRTTATELYACGCLLWQLLAGRPPFPAGDPLVKLAAHQTRRVADVRQWSPDVPASLAELLLSLTHPDPRQRPRNFAEVAKQLGRPSQHASPNLRRFARAFQSAAPRMTTAKEPPANQTRTMVVGFGLLCAVVLGGWMHGGVRMEVLRLTQPLRAAVQNSPDTAPASTSQSNVSRPPSTAAGPPAPAPAPTLLPLPEPDQGVVRLSSAGPYRASTVVAVGNLTIAGDQGLQPIVIVDDQPLIVSGVTVVVQNVAIVRSRNATVNQPLLDVTSQDFGLVDCLIDGGPTSTAAPSTTAAPFVRWQPVQAISATGGRIGWVNTVLTGSCDGLACEQSPASVQMQNVLHVATGALLRLPDASSARPLPITLKRVTLRGARTLVSMPIEPRQRPSALQVISERCLFDLPVPGGLIELRRGAAPAPLHEAVLACRLTGMESFLQTGTALAIQAAPEVSRQPVDATAMPIEGFQFSEIRFTGPTTDGWRTCAVDRDWSRLAGSQALGCDLEPFARWPTPPYDAVVPREWRTVEQP